MRLLVIQFFLLYSFCGFSQFNVIRVSVANDNKIGISYERFLSPEDAISLGIMHNRTFTGKTNGELLLFKAGERYNVGTRLYLQYRRYFYEIDKGILYFASRFSYGRHFVTYNSWDFDTRSIFTSASIGSLRIKGGEFGLSIGYQIQKEKFVTDLGIGLNQNFVVGEVQGITLSPNGEYKKFANDLTGLRFEIFLNFGIPF